MAHPDFKYADPSYFRMPDTPANRQARARIISYINEQVDVITKLELAQELNRIITEYKKSRKNKLVTYYLFLGVEPTATSTEIKQAYRQLQARLNINRFNQLKDTYDYSTLTHLLQRINEAYEVLSDTEKRKRYDRYGSTSPETEPTDAQSGRQATEPEPKSTVEAEPSPTENDNSRRIAELSTEIRYRITLYSLGEVMDMLNELHQLGGHFVVENAQGKIDFRYPQAILIQIYAALRVVHLNRAELQVKIDEISGIVRDAVGTKLLQLQTQIEQLRDYKCSSINQLIEVLATAEAAHYNLNRDNLGKEMGINRPIKFDQLDAVIMDLTALSRVTTIDAVKQKISVIPKIWDLDLQAFYLMIRSSEVTASLGAFQKTQLKIALGGKSAIAFKSLSSIFPDDVFRDRFIAMYTKNY